MFCPLCSDDLDPAIQRGDIAICSGCGASVINGRLATYADISQLEQTDIEALRRTRAKIARPDRRQTR